VTEYRVSIEVFEGPLDLLLTLVRREDLDISTVALARVTEGYLQYLANLREIDLGALAAFIEVASTLLLIKSRSLLPRSEGVSDDGSLEADDLAMRLRAFRQYRETADKLQQRERAGLRAYVRVAPPPDIAPPVKPGDASVEDLASAFEKALAEAAARADVPVPSTVSAQRVRLADRLIAIRALLDSRRSVRFSEVLIGDWPRREFIIVSFLAVLELLRRSVIRARQEELFGDIVLELLPEAMAAPWSAEEIVADVGDA
jgi:segregation and condensation protein A